MSAVFDQRSRVSLFTLIIAFPIILAQAATDHAQPSINEQAGASSRLPLLDAPYIDTYAPSSTGPALLALADVAGLGMAPAGGLWLSGDTAGAFAHLHWIAGNQPEGLLEMDSGGKISFNLRVLASAAGIIWENTADQRARIATFVRSDEGLRLLAEVTNGAYRFLLHVGPRAPTLAGNRRFSSALNLDYRFDIRINPRRPDRQKLKIECPPEGFDSLIAINPDVCWFNLHSRQLMPSSQITFHELAEAHARLVLGLDYLPQWNKPGAHNVAIEREIRLRQERLGQYVVMPIGYNSLLVSRDDCLRLLNRLQEERSAKSFLASR